MNFVLIILWFYFKVRLHKDEIRNFSSYRDKNLILDTELEVFPKTVDNQIADRKTFSFFYSTDETFNRHFYLHSHVTISSCFYLRNLSSVVFSFWR